MLTTAPDRETRSAKCLAQVAPIDIELLGHTLGR